MPFKSRKRKLLYAKLYAQATYRRKAPDRKRALAQLRKHFKHRVKLSLRERKKLRKIRDARWRERNRVKIAGWHKRKVIRIKTEVLSHYANGAPKCACCGEREIEFLTLDHIGGGGAADKRRFGPAATGWRAYQRLKRQGFPPGFQVLCWNCNCAQRVSNVCPHKRKKALVA